MFPLPIKKWISSISVVLMLSLSVLAISACNTPTNQTDAGPRSTQPTTRTPESQKISAKLLELEKRVKHDNQSLQQAGTNLAIVTSADGVKLDIVASRIDAGVEQQLAMPGVTIHFMSRKYKRISASISDLGLLHELAKIPEVVMISPQYPARTQ